jgi:ABC-type transport system involved in cytochrome bd biosynthesis fused ATPase/permease subunit
MVAWIREISTTRYGGEAQRMKLTRVVAKRGTGRTTYLLDELTTGLHFDDVLKPTSRRRGALNATIFPAIYLKLLNPMY